MSKKQGETPSLVSHSPSQTFNIYNLCATPPSSFSRKDIQERPLARLQESGVVIMKLSKMQTLMCKGSSSNVSPSIIKRVGNHSEGKATAAMVRVIKWDGAVIIYRRRIRASELMVQFPKHLVCDSQSFYIGQKVPPLDPRYKLHLGRNYFLLPMDAFQSVLSLVSVTSSFAAFKLRLSSTYKAVSSFQAFDVTKAPSGYLQIRVTDEFISKLMQLQQQKLNKSPSLKGGILCNTPQLSKEYSQLVVSSHMWKPKLEIIKESKKKKLSSSSFRMMKRSNKSKPGTKLLWWLRNHH